MRTLRNGILIVSCLTLAALCANPARPEDEPKKKHQAKLVAQEGAMEIVLLRHKSVQEDLKLSDDVVKKVKEFSSSQWKKAQAVQELPEESREAKWQAMHKENDAFLKETLTPEQAKRLDQIGMQVAGLLWVSRTDVAKQLGLTPEQKKKAHELRDTAHKEMHDVIHSESKEDKMEKLKELHETNAKRLQGLLTDEQKTEWKKLVGEKFTGDLSKD